MKNQAVVAAPEVMSGTFGELTIDGKLMAALKSVQAKVEYIYEDIQQCGSMVTQRKLMGYKITGSYGWHRVYSDGVTQAEAAKQGHMPEVTMVIKLDDPAAKGAERVALYGVTIDASVLADLVVGKPCEGTTSFQATDFEYLDKVEV